MARSREWGLELGYGGDLQVEGGRVSSWGMSATSGVAGAGSGAGPHLCAEVSAAGAALVKTQPPPMHLTRRHVRDLHRRPHQLPVGHLVTTADHLQGASKRLV